MTINGPTDYDLHREGCHDAACRGCIGAPFAEAARDVLLGVPDATEGHGVKLPED